MIIHVAAPATKGALRGRCAMAQAPAPPLSPTVRRARRPGRGDGEEWPYAREHIDAEYAASVRHGGDTLVTGDGKRVHDPVPRGPQRLRRGVRQDSSQPLGEQVAAARDLLGVGHHEPFHPWKPDCGLLFGGQPAKELGECVHGFAVTRGERQPPFDLRC